MLNHRLHVVDAPHRWYALEEEIHGVNQLRVIGGVSDCCLRLGLRFYDGRNNNLNNIEEIAAFDIGEEKNKNTVQNNRIIVNNNYSLQIPMHPVSEIEIAECSRK